jgi:hypothetical protein
MQDKDNVKEEEEQPLDSDKIPETSTAEKLEKVLDMKGRPYTAADEYAARLIQIEFLSSDFYFYIFFEKCVSTTQVSSKRI